MLDEDFVHLSVGLCHNIPRKISFRVVTLAFFYGQAVSNRELIDGERLRTLQVLDEDGAEWGTKRALTLHCGLRNFTSYPDAIDFEA